MDGNLLLLVPQQNGNLFMNWLPPGGFPDHLWLVDHPVELETDIILNSQSTDQIQKVNKNTQKTNETFYNVHHWLYLLSDYSFLGICVEYWPLVYK